MSGSFEKGGFRAWLVVTIGALYFSYNFIQMTMFNTMGGFFITKFHLSGGAEVGNFSAMYLYANTLFLIPAGLILDKFRIKRILVIAVLISSLGLLGLALSDQLWIALVMRFITGIVAAGAFTISLRLAVNWFPVHKLGFVIGVVITLAMLGGIAAQTPLQILVKNVGGQNAIYLIVGLGMVLMLIALFTVKDRPEAEKGKDDKVTKNSVGLVESLSAVLKNPQNWKAGFYTGLINLPIMILGAVWGTTYLEKSFGITGLVATSVIAMIFLGTIIGSPVVGWFSDKIRNRKIPMIVGALLALVIVSCIIFLPNISLSMLYVLFFLLGFITSTQSLGYPVVAESNNVKYNGTANGVACFIIMGCGAISQPLFGWLVQVFSGNSVAQISSYTPLAFKYAMISLPLCFVVALILVIFMKETGRKAAV